MDGSVGYLSAPKYAQHLMVEVVKYISPVKNNMFKFMVEPTTTYAVSEEKWIVHVHLKEFLINLFHFILWFYYISLSIKSSVVIEDLEAFCNSTIYLAAGNTKQQQPEENLPRSIVNVDWPMCC